MKTSGQKNSCYEVLVGDAHEAKMFVDATLIGELESQMNVNGSLARPLNDDGAAVEIGWRDPLLQENDGNHRVADCQSLGDCSMLLLERMMTKKREEVEGEMPRVEDEGVFRGGGTISQ
jgi:hypothetical protein